MESVLPPNPPELDWTVRIPSVDVWRLLEPLAAAMAGGPVSPFAIGQAVLSILDGIDHADTIKQMDDKLTRQIKAPMKNGRVHLYNALHTQDAGLRRDWLNEAVKQFAHARAVDAPPENIRATICLAVCVECLGDTDLATRWYQNSLEEAQKRQQQLLADLANLRVQAKIYYPLVLVLMATVVPAVAYFVWQEMAKKQFWNWYTEVFDLERQMLKLSQLLAGRNIANTPKLHFPPEVIEIQKWQVLIDNSNTGTPVLFAFDDQGWVVECIHLTDGKPLAHRDVKGYFSRNGQRFSGRWKPAPKPKS